MWFIEKFSNSNKFDQKVRPSAWKIPLLKDFQKTEKIEALDLLNELLATAKPYNMDNITIFLLQSFCACYSYDFIRKKELVWNEQDAFKKSKIQTLLADYFMNALQKQKGWFEYFTGLGCEIL